MSHTKRKAVPRSQSLGRLFRTFEMHDAKINALTRRMTILTCSGGNREDRLQALEELAEHEIDGIAHVALAISDVPAHKRHDLRLKARVLWSIIGDEPPASVADVLIRSLCRDLIVENRPRPAPPKLGSQKPSSLGAEP